ncbi:ATP-binding cassette domain-containing protein [Rhodococcus qingshengii JCM 15477]|uniref:ATP-binding cassette domain-containing protein n=2 Tax=Nocardiaceae TaxID=85025 RepID=A0AB38RM70_RHOSG|nr:MULTISPECIES: ATP-binding cassette domain-containing protein [Rhodococcus]ORC22525.1 ABC transporter ATP-binding protein [Rhodococcus qingshengii]UPU46131.1 ATP-binding cassette domain-containing protein [Rhodococcus qingshengii JCM 15477]
MAAEPAMQASSLYRFYRAGDEETLALQGVSVTASRGEFIVVAGPSGSGKSTLLACLAGMDDPDGGSVRIAGQRISNQPAPVQARIRARHVGMLFQDANLLEHLTLTQNIALVRGLVRRRDRVNTVNLLVELGLADRAAAYPSQLSGGELARAALSVALANAPTVLLADEPTGELDSVTESAVLDLLTVAAGGGTAIVVASHSAAVAAAATRVITLEDGRVRP